MQTGPDRAFVPLPVRSAWVCVLISAVLHAAYNLLLLQNYRMSDLSSAYPIARGISPSLVTFGAFLLMHQRPGVFAICGVAMISSVSSFSRQVKRGPARASRGEIANRLDDLGEGRLALMDNSGIDVQVLSVTTPSLHNLEPEVSISLARHTNDRVAEVVAKYPTRFQGFATLPTAAPEEAAMELNRGITRLGMKGTMLCGRTRDRNLDHPDFLPTFETAARSSIKTDLSAMFFSSEVQS